MAYRDLWCDFVLDETGLLCAGRDDLTHTVMADSQGPLLTAPVPVRVPPHAIVRALVPLADYEVPATVETTAPLRALPLPSVNPRAVSTARRGAGPLRPDCAVTHGCHLSLLATELIHHRLGSMPTAMISSSTATAPCNA